MLNLYRKIYNLRCPDCSAVQPVFGLLSTLRGGLFSVALNDFAPCVSCNSQLKLVYRHSLMVTLLFGFGFLMIHLGVFVFAIVPLLFGSFVVFGFFGLLLFPLLMALNSLLSAVFLRYYYPLFREVVVL